MSKRAGRRLPSRPGAVRKKGRARALSWPVIVAGVVVMALAVTVTVVLGLRGSDDGGGDSASLAAEIDQSSGAIPAGQANGFTLGSPDAPVSLVIFEDFQCPFCVRFTATIEPVIIDEYVKTGKVRLEFRNFPILGLESNNAARATVCAAEKNRFWEYANALFGLQAAAGQVENERINVGRFDTDGLVGLAAKVGLDRGAFSSCFAGAEATATVQEHTRQGTSAGVKGTPSFVLDGTLVQRAPSEVAGWRTLLDGRLTAAGKGTTPAPR